MNFLFLCLAQKREEKKWLDELAKENRRCVAVSKRDEERKLLNVLSPRPH